MPRAAYKPIAYPPPYRECERCKAFFTSAEGCPICEANSGPWHPIHICRFSVNGVECVVFLWDGLWYWCTDTLLPLRSEDSIPLGQEHYGLAVRDCTLSVLYNNAGIRAMPKGGVLWP